MHIIEDVWGVTGWDKGGMIGGLWGVVKVM